MAELILITGGAGFIGRNVGEELLRRGYRVRVLDALLDQVHGETSGADALDSGIDFQQGDVRDAGAVKAALRDVGAVVHLAAEVGVGQSMYEVVRYCDTNDLGTATLFEQLIETPVRRVVTASSMSIYGEGLYRTVDGEPVETAVREPQRGEVRDWNPRDGEGRPLSPVATPEWKRPALQSVYALNKYAQERLTHILAQSYGMESVCLRLFNVFGPGQALSNPYTGVLAIFAARLLNGQPPMIFEDGEQRRDFVHVRYVARAFADALERPGVSGETLNIGSGQDRSVREIAQQLAHAMGRGDLEPEITGKARIGDIRHCFADTRAAKDVLGFEAREDFAARLTELAQWVEAQQRAEDRVEHARGELERRGLVA